MYSGYGTTFNSKDWWSFNNDTARNIIIFGLDINILVLICFGINEFYSTLARYETKCLFLNDKPCMVRPTLINSNPIEFKYYEFMISLDKCSGSWML